MKGEFDSPSKAATGAYRIGWEHCFGREHPFVFTNIPVPQNYANGCPILDDEDQRTHQPNGQAA